MELNHTVLQFHQVHSWHSLVSLLLILEACISDILYVLMGILVKYRAQGQTGQLNPSNKYLKGLLNKVKKILNSEYVELQNVYIIKLWIYQKFAALFYICAHEFMLSRIHGPI